MTEMPEHRPRVVIVGGGFGGLAAAKALRRTAAEVILIDRTNHHVFQPLLYQVATAALSPSDITAPIRFILRHQRNTEVLMADVREIDRPFDPLLSLVAFESIDRAEEIEIVAGYCGLVSFMGSVSLSRPGIRQTNSA